MIFYQEYLCRSIVDLHVRFQNVKVKGRSKKTSITSPPMTVGKDKSITQPGKNETVGTHILHRLWL